MRAKFVPASSLYPSTQPDYNGEVMQSSEIGTVQMGTSGVPVQASAPMYATVEYSTFGTAPDSFQNFATQEQMYQNQAIYNGYEVDGFGTVAAPIKMSPYQTDQYSSMGQIPSHGKMSAKQETSKFGFGYDSLTENIDELDLVDSNDSEAYYAMSTAKSYIQIGKIEEAESILKELLENRKIEYKQMSLYFGNSIFNAFGPSEAN